MQTGTKRHLKSLVMMLSGGVLLASGDCLPRHFWADFAGFGIETTAGEIIAGMVGLFFP